MSLRHVDIGSALRRLADRRIEEAMQRGDFDNLSGAGKPIDLEPMPAEEDARLTWWAIRILRQSDFIPDEVRWRKILDGMKAELAGTRDEKRLRLLVAQINALVLRINTLGTNALKAAVVGVDLDEQLEGLRDRCIS
jgi:hypothetical protein